MLNCYKCLFNLRVKIYIEMFHFCVLVGGGTAGCVLASRLSEDEKISVLVLEAGGEETELFYSHIPGATAFLQQTDFDWQFFTVPQSDCCDGLNDNVHSQ